jgi:hypothetical protein
MTHTHAVCTQPQLQCAAGMQPISRALRSTSVHASAYPQQNNKVQPSPQRDIVESNNSAPGPRRPTAAPKPTANHQLCALRCSSTPTEPELKVMLWMVAFSQGQPLALCSATQHPSLKSATVIIRHPQHPAHSTVLCPDRVLASTDSTHQDIQAAVKLTVGRVHTALRSQRHTSGSSAKTISCAVTVTATAMRAWTTN